MSTGVSSRILLKWLRAAGEPSRLRLLALCTQGELSVSDLAQALAQSEPRVSRHLKILGEAGLIERVRQGQWVHYRITAAPAPMAFVRGLFGHLDRQDPVTAQVQGSGGRGPSRLGRALAAFANEALQPGVEAALLVGVAHPELLSAAAAAASRCTAVAHSRRAAQAARSHVRSEGLPCRVLEGAAAVALSPAALGKEPSFGLVLLDEPAADADQLARLLKATQPLLAPQGSLAVFGRYEALEAPRARVVEHPLARLRRLLTEAGFDCEKLSPVEADGEHVLAAVAHRASPPAARARSA